LGFRWVVNSAGKVKPRSGAKEATKVTRMEGRSLPPSEAVLGLTSADSASEDEYDLEPEVMDLDTTI
jgi:hypothetical protein